MARLNVESFGREDVYIGSDINQCKRQALMLGVLVSPGDSVSVTISDGASVYAWDRDALRWVKVNSKKDGTE